MNKHLTIEQVAELLNASTEWVRLKIASGEIPSIRITPRMIRVDAGDLQEWLDQKKEETHATTGS